MLIRRTRLSPSPRSGGLEVYSTGEDGAKYRVGDEPAEVQLRKPLESVIVDREKRWACGEKVELSAYDLAETSFMANHEAIDVLDALQEFGLRYGVTMKPAAIIRGGWLNWDQRRGQSR